MAWQMRMPTVEHTKHQSFLPFFQAIAVLILASCNPICNYVISYTLPLPWLHWLQICLTEVLKI